MYSFMGGGLFCAIVGNILLVVSAATDYWMQYRLSGNYAHQGLWRYCMSNKCYMQTDSIGETLAGGGGWSLPSPGQIKSRMLFCSPTVGPLRILWIFSL